MIGPGETCKAVNQENYPIKVGWGNVEYILRPGEDAYVPAEAIINFFGDPRATINMVRKEEANGQSSWLPDRPTEVRRLRVKWAAMNNSNAEDALITPKVDVYTLSGEWVPTVAADPDGEKVNPASLTQAQEQNRDDIIARMQAQLDHLLKERNISEEVRHVTVEGEIPVDTPTVSKNPPKTIMPKAANDD